MESKHNETLSTKQFAIVEVLQGIEFTLADMRETWVEIDEVVGWINLAHISQIAPKSSGLLYVRFVDGSEIVFGGEDAVTRVMSALRFRTA